MTLEDGFHDGGVIEDAFSSILLRILHDFVVSVLCVTGTRDEQSHQIVMAYMELCMQRTHF